MPASRRVEAGERREKEEGGYSRYKTVHVTGDTHREHLEVQKWCLDMQETLERDSGPFQEVQHTRKKHDRLVQNSVFGHGLDYVGTHHSNE